MDRSKKIMLALFIVLAIVLIYFFSSTNFGKVDDWEYNPASKNGLFYFAIGGGIVGIFWLASSIYLIARKNRTKRKINYSRRIGVCILLAPFILFGLAFILFFTNNFLSLLILPILTIASMIFGVIYSIKKQVKIAIVPIILLPIILFGAFFAFIFFGSYLYLDSSIQSKGINSLGGGVAYASLMESDGIGFSTGGAKDINNFRKNIKNNYLPLSTDITYEGLFYDYFFDTGEVQECSKLFCPSYSFAISKDPLSNEDEYYMQLGLNSGLKESDFKRKKLNLVVVLDVSGSMGSSFNRYYYDRFGNESFKEDEDYSKSKMQVASESVVGLLDHLNEDDRFGMVLFDDQAYLAKPLREVSETDIDAIKDHVLEIMDQGGTNMEAGYKKGTSLFDEYNDADSEEYENRIIFLTDAMPNRGILDEESLFGMTKKNADDKIYTTFIGIGVDFNTELIDYITKIRGANYYSVHSASEFKTRMDDEFEYMVTPLVFNLILNFDAPGYLIEKVYGSPEANESTGEIMKVNTLFPSKKEDGETKGGIVILKLKKIGSDESIKITTTYEDRSGKTDGEEVQTIFPQKTSDYYDNSGIRKGILLARYVNLMRNWIDDERVSIAEKKSVTPIMDYETGIVIPLEANFTLGRWERQSVPLQVSEEYKKMILDFTDYFKSEAAAIGDDSLSIEIEVMEVLSK